MEDIDIKSDDELLKLYSLSFPYSLTLRMTNFETPSDMLKFVRNCEKLIRQSYEYKLWREYIIDVLKENFCPITLETNEEVSIEIHHHVPSLFSLVKSVVNKYIYENKEFCSFDICLDVISLHYQNKIGYIPLATTIHQKVSNNCLQIPIKLIKGNYKQFIDEYSKYFDDDDNNIINERLKYNVDIKSWTKDNYPGLQMAMAE